MRYMRPPNFFSEIKSPYVCFFGGLSLAFLCYSEDKEQLRFAFSLLLTTLAGLISRNAVVRSFAVAGAIGQYFFSPPENNICPKPPEDLQELLLERGMNLLIQSPKLCFTVAFGIIALEKIHYLEVPLNRIFTRRQ